MIIDVMSGKALKMPRAQDFKLLRSRLSSTEFDAIVTHINEMIDDVGGEMATAGWLPGSDWTGSPFQPIHDKAAAKDRGLSGKFFGLLVWYAVMERAETWETGKYHVNGREIGSRTYFRVLSPPTGA